MFRKFKIDGIKQKRAGSDGLPAEFYKIFWNEINEHLLNALKKKKKKSLLSITQRRGLITLIPKKNKPTNLLKNWRPITLLYCDYKMATAQGVPLLAVDVRTLNVQLEIFKVLMKDGEFTCFDDILAKIKQLSEIITLCKLLLANPATSAADERFFFFCSETENVATLDDDTKKI